MNAYIPMGSMQQFRCASHNGATLRLHIRIGNFKADDNSILMSNGVSSTPNNSITSGIIITFDSEEGIEVANIECLITLNTADGRKIQQQCSIFIYIHLYGEKCWLHSLSRAQVHSLSHILHIIMKVLSQE